MHGCSRLVVQRAFHRTPVMHQVLCAAALLAAAAGVAHAEEAGWTQVALEDGITVEQQAVPGRGMPKFRGRGEVGAGVDEILAVISDASRHTDWMPDCAESRVVASKGEVTYLYRRNAAPWPVSDRDVVIASRTEVVEPGELVLVHFESVTEPSVATPSGVVRMPHLAGHYRIQRVGPARSEVELEVDADPGGSLPASLAAGTARDNPLQTLLALREQVAADR
jgi:hypothetical protein